MENMTIIFDYIYTYENDTPVPPCSRTGDNLLGAHLSILFYFMFLFSLVGNGLVLVIIHRTCFIMALQTTSLRSHQENMLNIRFEKLTTVTNILLLNLILSSTIFMSSLPFMAVYMQLSDWVFGSVMCKVVGGMYYLGIYSSVLFLTLLTFDRHLAVVYSLSAVRSLSYARISCVVVWLVSLLACAKQMILHTTFTHAFENRRFCDEYPLLSPLHSQLKAAGFYLQLFLFLLFPLAVIIYCYVRIAITVISSKLASKFRTVRLIIFIVVLFFMCWTPFNIALLLDDTDDCEESQNRDYVLQITRNLAYLYFCISPILYTFVGRKFQNYFRQMLVKRFPALKNRVSVSQSGTNGSTRTTRNDL